jgi:hypothetical protein
MNLKQIPKFELIVAIILVLFAVSARMFPHPPNVAPITAVALFAGAYLPRKIALSVPLAAIIISDIFIGFHSLIVVTWGTFVLIGYLSSKWLTKKQSAGRIFGMTIGSSLLFFVITNFAVWAEGFLYPRTAEGLAQSYIMAIPFLRNTLIGDLVFSAALFGMYAVAVRIGTSLKITTEFTSK